jgi:hypothetical protein
MNVARPALLESNFTQGACLLDVERLGSDLVARASIRKAGGKTSRQTEACVLSAYVTIQTLSFAIFAAVSTAEKSRTIDVMSMRNAIH